MSPVRMSKLESGTRAVLAFAKAFNRHDVAEMIQLMSGDCVMEAASPAPDGLVYSGQAAITQFWEDFFCDSPEAHIEVEEVSGIGLRCILRWRGKLGRLSRGKETCPGCGDIFRVENGLIRERLSYIKGVRRKQIRAFQGGTRSNSSRMLPHRRKNTRRFATRLNSW